MKTKQWPSSGGLPAVIDDDEEVLSDGDLRHYFRVLVNHAKNHLLPYHNIRHMMHVPWLCYDACVYYVRLGLMTRREARTLMIASIFHDFNNIGRPNCDDINIELAVRGVREHILDIDREYLEDIITLIRSTQYPYVVEADDLTLLGKILRDADVCQALASAWMQQTVWGLATEMGLRWSEMLARQKPFLSGLKLLTEWAQKKFCKEEINAKIAEAERLIEQLDVKFVPMV